MTVWRLPAVIGDVPVAVNRRSSDTQINSNNRSDFGASAVTEPVEVQSSADAHGSLSCWLKCWGIRFHDDMQPPASFPVTHQVSTGVFPVQILAVILDYLKGQLYPSSNSENRYLILTKVILWKALHPAPPSSVSQEWAGRKAGRFL
jgi:hypothetical protein